jgi:hypothetical protein
MVIDADGYDDDNRATGENIVITRDDGNVVIGGTGDVNAQIEDSAGRSHHGRGEHKHQRGWCILRVHALRPHPSVPHHVERGAIGMTLARLAGHANDTGSRLRVVSEGQPRHTKHDV